MDGGPRGSKPSLGGSQTTIDRRRDVDSGPQTPGSPRRVRAADIASKTAIEEVFHEVELTMAPISGVIVPQAISTMAFSNSKLMGPDAEGHGPESDRSLESSRNYDGRTIGFFHSIFLDVVLHRRCRHIGLCCCKWIPWMTCALQESNW